MMPPSTPAVHACGVACYALNVSRSLQLPSSPLAAVPDQFLLVGPAHRALLEKAHAFAQTRCDGPALVISFEGDGGFHTRDTFKELLAARCLQGERRQGVLVLAHIDKAPAALASTITGLFMLGMVPAPGGTLMDLRAYYLFATFEGTPENVPDGIRQRICWPVYFAEDAVPLVPVARP